MPLATPKPQEVVVRGENNDKEEDDDDNDESDDFNEGDVMDETVTYDIVSRKYVKNGANREKRGAVKLKSNVDNSNVSTKVDNNVVTNTANSGGDGKAKIHDNDKRDNSDKRNNIDVERNGNNNCCNHHGGNSNNNGNNGNNGNDGSALVELKEVDEMDDWIGKEDEIKTKDLRKTKDSKSKSEGQTPSRSKDVVGVGNGINSVERNGKKKNIGDGEIAEMEQMDGWIEGGGGAGGVGAESPEVREAKRRMALLNRFRFDEDRQVNSFIWDL